MKKDKLKMTNEQKSDELACTCGHCHSGEKCAEYEEKNNFFSQYGFEIFKICISVLLLIVAIILKNQLGRTIFFTCSAIVCGYVLIINFIKDLIKFKLLNENTLMFLAMITSYILCEYFESCFIVILYSLGELLEQIATDSSRKKITNLSKLKSKEIRVMTAQGVKSFHPDEVEIGSLIEIRTGEIVPIDGVLLAGITDLDVKAITGESKLLSIEKGAEVYSGSINMGNPIVIRTTKLHKDSTVEKIVSMVEGALSKKADSQKFITTFAKFYTPVIFFVAIFVAVFPPFLDNMNFTKWIYKSLTFLVVSCPCALVISVPLSFFTGIGALAKSGILVKGSKFIESISKVKTVIFDKTGTLTYGNFVVDKVECLSKFNEQEILSLVVPLEEKTTHPIAKAFKVFGKSYKSESVENFKELSGKGVVGNIKDKNVAVGNVKLMRDLGVSVMSEDYFGSILYVSIDNVLSGKIYIIDEIKKNAKTSLQEIKKTGVEKIGILSGDIRGAVEHVSREICADFSKFELLPNDKVKHLENILTHEQGLVMYVGDGINDTPCIAMSDVGVSMGALGSEVASESADVVIMDDDLGKIPILFKHSKRIRKRVVENIVGSLSVKFAVMCLGLFTFMPIWISMFADVGVMLLAVCNSLRNFNLK